MMRRLSPKKAESEGGLQVTTPHRCIATIVQTLTVSDRGNYRDIRSFNGGH